jgi:hypothetical protein
MTDSNTGELFVTNNEAIRDWFVNLVFSGKTLYRINKMPKKQLDEIDEQFNSLMQLIDAYTQRKEIEARIDELQLTGDYVKGSPIAYPELAGGFMNNYLNDRRAELLANKDNNKETR